MRANSTRVAPAEPAEPASTSGENSSPLAVDPTELAVTAAVVAQRSAHRLRATAKSAHALLTEVKHQSSCVPQQLFAKLDKDQNGYLSIVEYEKLGTSLNGALRDAFSSGELKSMFKQMTVLEKKSTIGASSIGTDAPPGEVSYAAFIRVLSNRWAQESNIMSLLHLPVCHWHSALFHARLTLLCERPQKALTGKQRAMRAPVRKEFDRLAKLTTGTRFLHREGFGVLVNNVEPMLLLIGQPFDLSRDWRLMKNMEPSLPKSGTTNPEGPVSFETFECWWRSRMCTQEDASVPVIPEYIARRVQERFPSSSADQVLRRRRSGKQLWNLLKPRLELLVTMTREWGAVHEMYAQIEDRRILQPELPWHIIDSDSMLSAVWDVASLVLLLYVTAITPYRICFGADAKLHSSTWYVDLVVDIFFILDLLYHFRLSYWNRKGERISDSKKIAKSYLRGWFAFDFAAALPVQYIMVAAQTENTNGENSRVLKSVRLLRFGRMIRVAKLKQILEKYNTEQHQVRQYIWIFTLALLIVTALHLLGCLWFFAGTQSTEEEGREVGWVNREMDGLIAGGPERPGFNVTGDHEFSRYVTSLFMVLEGRRWAHTTVERFAAILGYLCTIVIAGSVNGLITANLVGMGAVDKAVARKCRSVQTWMEDNVVPRSVQTKTLKYFRSYYKSAMVYDESAIVALMPPSLRTDFTLFIYGEVIRKAPMFRDLSEEIIASLCNVARPLTIVTDQIVFAEGSSGDEMYFLLRGELEVTSGRTKLGYLGRGAFFGEVPVLTSETGAKLRRRTITGASMCKLCYLKCSDISHLTNNFPALKLRIRRTAKFGGAVNRKGSAFKDVQSAIMVDPKRVIEDFMNEELEETPVRKAQPPDTDRVVPSTSARRRGKLARVGSDVRSGSEDTDVVQRLNNLESRMESMQADVKKTNTTMAEVLQAVTELKTNIGATPALNRWRVGVAQKGRGPSAPSLGGRGRGSGGLPGATEED